MSKTCIQMAIAALAFVAAASAQPAHRAPAGPPTEGRVMLHSGQGGGVVGWMVAEMGPGGRVVKGTPYSAIAVTDVVQTLADGNKIHRETAGAVYRDSEGRTRNENQAAGAGPMSPAGLPQFITITDPVAGVNYLLNPADKTVIKTALPGRRPAAGAVQHAPGRAQNPQEVKTEQLGTKTIEGVQAEGTRVTHTIPAGQIGNERPIEIVSERWYSPQLQVIVATTHSDPRMGTNTYKLTKINLGEPDRSLFEIPAGYTVKEGGVVGGVPAQRQPAVKHE